MNHCQLWLLMISHLQPPPLALHAGQQRKEGGASRVTQQEHFNDLSSSCKTPLEQHRPVLHQHPRALSQR